MMKLQLFEQAVKAKPMWLWKHREVLVLVHLHLHPPTMLFWRNTQQERSIGTNSNSQTTSRCTSKDDPAAAYLARYNKSRTVGLSVVAMVWMIQHQIIDADSKDLITIMQTLIQQGRESLETDSKPAPETPYSLLTGCNGCAYLGINSELPGQIMAQVSQDIYDTRGGA